MPRSVSSSFAVVPVTLRMSEAADAANACADACGIRPPESTGSVMTAEPLGRLFATGHVAAPQARPPLLRGVHEADLPELERLEQEVFQDAAYPAFILRQFYEVYADHFLVLDNGTGSLHGYVLAPPTPCGRDAWVLALCVALDRRSQGFGRALMAAVLAHLCSMSIETVRLTVEPDNHPAIELYHSLGFRVEEPDGGVRRDYFGRGEDRLVMSLALGPGH